MSSKNIKNAVNLTGYFFSLPSARNLVLGIIILGLIFGLLFDLGKAEGLNYFAQAILDGTTLLILPAFLSAIVIKLLIRRMPFNRILATTFGGELVYGLAYSASILVADVNLFYAELILLVGSAIVFIFWYSIARLVFILKYRSVLFAIIQLLFYLIFFFSNQALYATDLSFVDFAAKFYLSSFVLLIALILFFHIINAPMKKSFGFSSTDAATYFVSQWLYHNKDLEDAFETVGQRVKTLVSVMGFKRKNDNIFFITPYVHFGPFGNLGGSEFSYLIAEEMKKKYNATSFVFHGTVTHDLNPVASSELSKIMNTVDNIIKNADYKPATISLQLGSEDECKSETLVINDSAFVGISRAPLVTEDINFGLGLSMIYSAERYVKNAMVVDQHNAETGEITSFEPGEEVGYRYLRAVKYSLQKKSKKNKLKIGISSSCPDSPVIGGAGIKVSAFSCNPTYVMVLLDCNGVTPDFRARIEKEVKSLKKGEVTVGVFTTDTHQTNIVKGVLNPLKEEESIIKEINTLVLDALDDMQDAEFFADKKWFSVNVLGAKQSIELVSTVNSIVAVAKIVAPLILIAAVLVLIAVVAKI